MFSNFNEQSEGENHWTSISDMMAGLMVIFLFIAISMIVVEKSEKETIKKEKDEVVKIKSKVEKEKEILRIKSLTLQIEKQKIKEIAVAFKKIQLNLYEELYKAFKDDLPRWGATIDKESLTVEFGQKSDEIKVIYFDSNDDKIKPTFVSILDEFFPRYLKIIYQEKYRSSIEEIRIEGHTSSEWDNETTAINAYFNNMELSQARTRSVLKHCLGHISEPEIRKWTTQHLLAIGFSSSRLRYTNFSEDKDKSRRVTFCTKTNAKEQIISIVEKFEEMDTAENSL
jgi:outer membrane protein OmpA-like peptidoglycan-associated protein